MAELTIDRAEIFPPGTSLSIYERGSFPNGVEAGPTGAALSTHLVGGTGEIVEEKEVIDQAVTAVKFTGLTTARTYMVAGKVGGTWRGVRVVCGKMGASLSPPARYSSHVAG